MSDPRQIKYTASVDDSPFAAGTARIGAALAGVQQRFAGTGRDWANVTSAMRGQIGAVADSVRDSVSAMGGHFSGLLGALGRTSAGMLGLVAAGAALAASKAVEATAKQTEATMDLSRVLGITTNEASAWRTALEDVGATQGELEGAAKGMSRQLKENEADMQAMGLRTRDAAGNLRPMNELLVDGFDLLGTYKEGTDRALASQALFGRGVDASSKLLLLNKGVLNESHKANQELGLEVGERSTKAWAAYDAATDRARLSVRGLVTAVGNSLMPVLSDLVGYFNSVMPTAITVVRGALGGLVTAFEFVRNGVIAVWEVINAMVVTVAEPIRALAEAIGRGITGDFSGAAAAIRGIGGTISGAWSQAMDNIAASSQRTRDRVATIWGFGDSDETAAWGREARGGGTRTYTPPPKKEKAKKDKEAREAQDPSFMQYYEAALAEEKRLATERDALREYTKEQELAFWRNLLDNADLAGKDRVAITRKVADLEVQILREQAKQRAALEAEQLKGQQDRALGAIELAQAEAQAQFQLGEISKAQLLEQERHFEEQKAAIRRQYLQAKLADVDPDRDPVLYEQISQQIEELERQHRLRMKQLDTAKLLEEKDNPITRTWQAAERSLDQAVQGIINRTMSLRQAMASIWAGIRQQVVAEIGRIVAAEAVAWVKKRAMAIFSIGADSAKAGAGAASAMASIPYVGPFLAAASMATMIASVGALAGKVPSARGGFDIPFGVNPLTQLHEREMVLPQAQADVVRSMAKDGASGGIRPLNLTINAMDGQSVRRVLLDNQSSLSEAMLKVERDGRLGFGA